MEYLLIIFVFVSGAIIGSFLNVLIGRLPKEEKLTGRSHCPNCKHTLAVKDLVPLLSYLWLKGKCAYCGQKISARYFLVELVTGVLFVLSFIFLSPHMDFLSQGSWVDLIQWWFIVAVLVVVFVTDLEHYLILDKVVWPASIVMLAFNLWPDLNPIADWRNSLTLNALLGALIGSLPFYILWKVSKGRVIGLGDAKLGIFLGLVFGFPMILVTYFLSFALGTLVSIPLLLAGKKSLTSKLPLGTFLALGAVITLFWGLDILMWYLNLLGI